MATVKKCMSCGGSMKKMQKGGSAKVTVATVSPNNPYEKKKAELAKKRAEVEARYNAKMKVASAKNKAEKTMDTGYKKATSKLDKKALGGATEIVGMPKYGNNPRTQTGAMVKKGGSVINRAVSPGCRGGQVKDASGKCVNERKFKAGGATSKFAALAPPYNKATAADRIAGAKKNARKK